jgi:hypothetical protein
MKVGDWVVDRYQNVGVVAKLNEPMSYAVMVKWRAYLSRWEVPHPFVEKKYLTVITKEVADVIIKSNEKE